MKLGIFGGSFNPPHLGHLAAAKAAIEALGLDKLLLIPAALPPHKELPPGTPPAAERLRMTEIAADTMLLPRQVEVSDMELERTGKSYTADTLRRLREQYPDAELWLLVGTDMFLTLQEWHEPAEVMALAGICAFSRTGEDRTAEFDAQTRRLQEAYGARVKRIAVPGLVEVSSTQLREALAEDGSGAGLPPSVYGYILRHGLYQTHADLKHLTDPQLRACAYSMMRAKRIAHVQGTETEAVKLAQRWGGDVEKARRAAILHDCTKYDTMEEQKAVCRQYGIELDELEQKALKLLHSKTGACMARYVYGQDDEIYEAIFWHTTGKADMSLLEKILYIADYMEPNRDFPGVERLRELAYQDLDEAVLTGCQMSIEEMEERGLPVHQNTVQARDWLKARKG